MKALRDALAGDERGTARALGGLLLATGILVLLFRKTATLEPWDEGLVFVILALTVAFLYGSGLSGALGGPRPHGWQSAFVIFGLLLLPIALFAFLQWIDGDPEAPLNSVWIFAATAAAAFAAGLLARIRFAFLLGSLALIVVWLAFWDALLGDGVFDDIGTLRGLLLLIALILLALAAFVSMRGSSPEDAARDVVTGAGIAAVAAGGIGFVSTIGALRFFGAPLFETNLFWDLELLVASLALLIYGTTGTTRGPAYVGGLGLIAFIYILGLDFEAARDGDIGWPLVLLIGGGLLFAASLIPALRRARA